MKAPPVSQVDPKTATVTTVAYPSVGMDSKGSDLRIVASAGLRAFVDGYLGLHPKHPSEELMREIVRATPDTGSRIDLFRAWALETLEQSCHHSHLLSDLSRAYLDQEEVMTGTRRTSPQLLFKGILQATCSRPQALSDMVGETLAELVSVDQLEDCNVLAILQGAAGRNPNSACRDRCFACLSAFLRRLALLDYLVLDLEHLSPLKEALPRLLPQGAANIHGDPARAGHFLHEAGLEPLAMALSLPAPAAIPRDRHGYYTGVLEDGTDPDWWPALEYDPEALDRRRCSNLDQHIWPPLPPAQPPDQLMFNLPFPNGGSHSSKSASAPMKASSSSSHRAMDQSGKHGNPSASTQHPPPGSLPLMGGQPPKTSTLGSTFASVPGSLPLVPSPSSTSGIGFSAVPGSMPLVSMHHPSIHIGASSRVPGSSPLTDHLPSDVNGNIMRWPQSSIPLADTLAWLMSQHQKGLGAPFSPSSLPLSPFQAAPSLQPQQQQLQQQLQQPGSANRPPADLSQLLPTDAYPDPAPSQRSSAHSQPGNDQHLPSDNGAAAFVSEAWVTPSAPFTARAPDPSKASTARGALVMSTATTATAIPRPTGLHTNPFAIDSEVGHPITARIMAGKGARPALSDGPVRLPQPRTLEVSMQHLLPEAVVSQETPAGGNLAASGTPPETFRSAAQGDGLSAVPALPSIPAAEVSSGLSFSSVPGVGSDPAQSLRAVVGRTFPQDAHRLSSEAERNEMWGKVGESMADAASAEANLGVARADAVPRAKVSRSQKSTPLQMQHTDGDDAAAATSSESKASLPSAELPQRARTSRSKKAAFVTDELPASDGNVCAHKPPAPPPSPSQTAPKTHDTAAEPAAAKPQGSKSKQAVANDDKQPALDQVSAAPLPLARTFAFGGVAADSNAAAAHSAKAANSKSMAAQDQLPGGSQVSASSTAAATLALSNDSSAADALAGKPHPRAKSNRAKKAALHRHGASGQDPTPHAEGPETRKRGDLYEELLAHARAGQNLSETDGVALEPVGDEPEPAPSPVQPARGAFVDLGIAEGGDFAALNAEDPADPAEREDAEKDEESGQMNDAEQNAGTKAHAKKKKKKKTQKAEDPQEKEAREAAEQQLLEEAVAAVKKEAADKAAAEAAAAAETEARAEAEEAVANAISRLHDERAAPPSNRLQLPAPPASQQQPAADGPQERKKILRLRDRKIQKQREREEDVANNMLRRLEKKSLEATMHEAQAKLQSAKKTAGKQPLRASSTSSDVLEDAPAPLHDTHHSNSGMSPGKTSPLDSRSYSHGRRFPGAQVPGNPDINGKSPAVHRGRPCRCHSLFSASDSDSQTDEQTGIMQRHCRNYPGPGPDSEVHPAVRLAKGMWQAKPDGTPAPSSPQDHRLQGHHHPCHHVMSHQHQHHDSRHHHIDVKAGHGNVSHALLDDELPASEQVSAHDRSLGGLPDILTNTQSDLPVPCGDLPSAFANQSSPAHGGHCSAGPAERLLYDPLNRLDRCPIHNHGMLPEEAIRQHVRSQAGQFSSQPQQHQTTLAGLQGYDRENDCSWEDVSFPREACGNVRDATDIPRRKRHAEPLHQHSQTSPNSHMRELQASASEGPSWQVTTLPQRQAAMYLASQDPRLLQSETGTMPGAHVPGSLQDLDDGPYHDTEQMLGGWPDDVEEEMEEVDHDLSHFYPALAGCEFETLNETVTVFKPVSSSPAAAKLKGREVLEFLLAHGYEYELLDNGHVHMAKPSSASTQPTPNSSPQHRQHSSSGAQQQQQQQQQRHAGTVRHDAPPVQPSLVGEQLSDFEATSEADLMRAHLVGEQLSVFEANSEADFVRAHPEVDLDADWAHLDLQQSHQNEAFSSSSRQSCPQHLGLQSPGHLAKGHADADRARFQAQQVWASGGSSAGETSHQYPSGTNGYEAIFDGRSEATERQPGPEGLYDSSSDLDDLSECSETGCCRAASEQGLSFSAFIKEAYMQCADFLRVLLELQPSACDFFDAQLDALLQQHDPQLNSWHARATTELDKLPMKTLMPVLHWHLQTRRVAQQLLQQGNLTPTHILKMPVITVLSVPNIFQRPRSAKASTTWDRQLRDRSGKCTEHRPY
ncbi:hypothetical protein WJX74_005326 [Apatococcus lobatus]|uniref:Uncharacterized protein n=1 Tax=Apatococcus lobatus TaxID=904363 RepID=A0AAW1QDS9_9CHLO